MILFLGSIIPSFADEQPRPSLLILGDSLSAGYRLSNEKSWPVLLNNVIEEKTQSHNPPLLNVQIINASISGDTAEQGLARLSNLLDTYKPNYILIELGANNGLQGLDTNNLKTTLKTIISNSRAAGAEPILMQIDIPRNYGKRYVDAFSAVYPAIATELNVPLIPFFMQSVVINNEQNGGLWLQDDGIHPTEAAQPFIANWMYDTLISTLNVKE